MTKELTPWFGGDVKPIRVGVYMSPSGFRDADGYQYWNGSYWGTWGTTIAEAFSRRREAAAAIFQDDKWRGLAVKP